jgi:carbon-monoxide dehydrogenase large subunit
MHVTVEGLMMHVNPAAAYRGAGRPEYCYVIERLVDTAARETGRDPVALRKLNMIPPELIPYTTALGSTYDSGDFANVMAEALDLADWAGFEARRKESEAKGLLRGRGLACSIERAGLPAQGEHTRLKLRDDGTVSMAIGTHSHGQGHETAFRQVLGDALGMSFDAISFEQGDTELLVGGGGTMGSRSAAVGGGVLRIAAGKLIEAAKQVASEVLEAAVADIEFDGQLFRVAGSDLTLDWQRLAREAAARNMLEALDIAEDYKIADAAWPNGCAVAEVEIDPETGKTALVRYAVMGDYGVVLNPMLLEGQLHGGISQGAGQILQEVLRWDPETGQPLSASFMDYSMPRAADLPMMTTATHPVPTGSNLMGIKGAGEAGCVSSMPAVMNAVVDALAPLGVRHLDMPASPERVWAAIAAARR